MCLMTLFAHTELYLWIFKTTAFIYKIQLKSTYANTYIVLFVIHVHR